MPNAYPMEFRRDVVQVARNRDPGVSLERIARDFGIHPISLSNRLKRADIDEGRRTRVTQSQWVELQQANKRIRLLEQEAEVLKRALAHASQGLILGKGSTRSQASSLVTGSPSRCRAGC